MKKQNNASKRIVAAVLAVLSFAGTANYPAVAELFQPSSITASAQEAVVYDMDTGSQKEQVAVEQNSKVEVKQIQSEYVAPKAIKGNYDAHSKYSSLSLDGVNRSSAHIVDYGKDPFYKQITDASKSVEGKAKRYVSIKLNKDVLVSDCVLSGIINSNSNVVIDLNGNNIVNFRGPESKDEAPVIINKGKLTIIDSSDEKTGGFYGFITTVIKNEEGAELNILDGVFNNNRTSVIENNGTINILGGDFTDNMIKGYGLIVNESKGIVNISGGLFKRNTADDGTVVYAKAGSQVNITGGRFDNNKANGKGGVVCTEDKAQLTVKGVDVTDNSAKLGGAFAVSGKTEISDSHIMGSTAEIGGAIFAEGNADVSAKGTYFYGCKANNGGAAFVDNGKFDMESSKAHMCSAVKEGGVVYTKGAANINNCEFKSNLAEAGGVILSAKDAVVKISGSKASDNIAKGYGSVALFNGIEAALSDNEFTDNGYFNYVNSFAGVRGTVCVTKGSKATINNNKFSGNKADSGSAVYSEGNLEMTKCEIAKNQATEGTIQVTSDSAVVDDCQFVDNYAIYGSVVSASGQENDVTVKNTTASNNTYSNILASGKLTIDNVSIDNKNSKSSAVEVNNAVCDIKNSSISNSSGQNGAAVSAVMGSVVTITDTKLNNNKAKNGAAISVERSQVTVTGGEIKGNVAENHGAAILAYNKSKVTVSGTQISENKAKMGAIYVTGESTADLNKAVFSKNDAEKGAAAYVDNKSVLTASGVIIKDNTDKNAGALFNEGTAEIIDGTFTSNTSVLGGGAIRNNGVMTIKGERSELSKNVSDNGGSIYNEGKLSVIDAKFKSNSININGAAIYNYYGELTVSGEKTEFSNNTAKGGAAIYNTGKAMITGGKFISNIAHNNGGAIINLHGELTISGKNILFSGNSAISGGALYSWNKSERVTVNGATFTDNKAEYEGGAIACDIFNSVNGTLLNVTGSVFRNNSAQRGGAIDSDAEMNVANTQFIGNTVAKLGGAISTSNKLTLKASTFTANVAGSEFTTGTNGGAIFSTGTQAITDEGSVFTSNRSNLGGAVCHFGDPKGASDVFKNTVFKDNIAENGGAAYTKAGVDFYNADISFNTAKRDAGAVYHFGTLGIYDGTRILNNRAFANGGANVFGEGLTTTAPVKVKGKVFVSQNNDKNGSSNVKLSGHESILVQGDITGSAICVSSADDLKFTVDYEKYMKDNDPAQFFIADEEGGKISYHEFEAYKNQIIGSFKDAKLTIDNAISLRVFINFTKDLPADKLQYAYVLVKGASYGTKGEVVKVVKDENGKYYIDLPLAAKYMSDQINLDLYYNDVLQASKSTSIREYANTILSDASYKDAHELVKAMLNYGSKAQILFNQNTTDSAMGDRFYKSEAAVKTADILANEPKYINFVKPESIKGLSFEKTTLELESEIKQRQYFTLAEGAKISDYTFYINNQVVKPIANGKNTYYIVTGETRLCDLAKAVDFKVVCNKAAGVMSFSCSPMDYIANAIKNGDSKDVKTQNKIDTCRALFWYYNELVSFNGGSIAGKTADI